MKTALVAIGLILAALVVAAVVAVNSLGPRTFWEAATAVAATRARAGRPTES